MPLGMETGLGTGDFVFDGDPAHTKKGHTHHTTQFLAYVYCGQTAGWIKMPLDILCYGVAATPKTGHSPSQFFSSCLLWPNGWMDEDVTWYGSKPWPRPQCIRRGPSSQRKRHRSPPSFRPMSIVATVIHLNYC